MKNIKLFCAIIFASLICGCTNSGNNHGSTSTSQVEKPDIGNWKIKTFVDKYGDNTSEKYIELECRGQFSRDGREPVPCSVILWGTKNGMYLTVYQHRDYSPVRDNDVRVIFYDSYGNRYPFEDGSWADKRGDIDLKKTRFHGAANISEYDAFINLLKEEKEIKGFVGVPYITNRDRCNFKINPTGYNEAISQL